MNTIRMKRIKQYFLPQELIEQLIKLLIIDYLRSDLNYELIYDFVSQKDFVNPHLIHVIFKLEVELKICD